ncbi:MAG: hypothetical protein K9K36_04775 [Desulfarculaceae bacterium]|nr:hypothetical protein [Desulfarculaceae bacterium]MCF8048818.1 hypothetical protein [Desulfarculaceae bacterium]MCF8064536.1 hypothetical protein [Desulfarculaceae bacterium]MCF8121965.1 hypothetical protein [Desulfarculaceae bacterium]
MKKILLALLAIALLLTAAPAGAYTVYNHVDAQVCIIDAGYPQYCAIPVAAGGTYHSQQGDVWQDVWVGWDGKPGTCYLSERIFAIPQQGSAKIYQDKVETYGQDGALTETVGIKPRVCASRKGK